MKKEEKKAKAATDDTLVEEIIQPVVEEVATVEEATEQK